MSKKKLDVFTCVQCIEETGKSSTYTQGQLKSHVRAAHKPKVMV